MRGRHYLKSWSSTQKNVTLSSGEAELVAAVKASTEMLGVRQLANEWGKQFHGEIYVDSTAALGVIRRKGNGKLRHVREGMLWVQQMEDEGELKYKKVHGEHNPGDMMTKYVNKTITDRLVGYMGQQFRDGQATTSLRIQ